ncbi:hypothetical protein ACSTKO_00215 [Vibrio parahaemolyticus]|nr:hypothetical protein [Vibrio parahaemolyticus]
MKELVSASSQATANRFQSVLAITGAFIYVKKLVAFPPVFSGLWI